MTHLLTLLLCMRLLVPFLLSFGRASMGMSGTNGFPAELPSIRRALSAHTGAGLAALVGIVLGAGCFLGVQRRASLGPTGNSVVADALDLRNRELLLVSVLAVLILLPGLWPNSLLDVTLGAPANGPLTCDRAV